MGRDTVQDFTPNVDRLDPRAMWVANLAQALDIATPDGPDLHFDLRGGGRLASRGWRRRS